MPKKLPTAPMYTLVLDLDGTLVYCTREEGDHYDTTFEVLFLIQFYSRFQASTTSLEMKWN